jgi:hypothetical protein
MVPRGWRPGDAVLLAESEGTLEGDAALIAWLWRAVPELSLAHDVGDGGLEHALAEASRWSGHEVRGDGAAAHGSVLLSCAHGVELDWPRLRTLGRVA